MYTGVLIQVVTAIVVVPSNVTRDAAVRTEYGQELLVVPDQAAGLCAVWVYWEVSWERTEKAQNKQTDVTDTGQLGAECIYGHIFSSSAYSFFPKSIYGIVKSIFCYSVIMLRPNF